MTGLLDGSLDMDTSKIYWVADSGHEWLAVPLCQARKVSGISSYSYMSPAGRIAYLEGDCDAPLFIEQFELDGVKFGAPKIYENQAPCRNYPAYKAGR